MSVNKIISSTKKRPILTGLFSVLIVFAAGIGIAYTTGFATPDNAEALVALPPCCTVPTPIVPPVIPTPVPIIPPLPIITPPVIPPVVPPVPNLLPECSISASKTDISPGDSVDLSWTSERAVSMSIDNGVGSVAVNGSQSVTPSDTTTYKGTVTDSDGDTKNCSVTVKVHPAPTCDAFTATPSTIASGDSSKLEWETTNATKVSIDNGVGSVDVDGSKDVSPTTNTNYTLTAENAVGATAICSAPVSISNTPQAPTCTLSASPDTINSGDSSTLTWTTTNADTATIDNGVGSVTPVAGGTKDVSPTSDTTYKMTVTGAGGTSTCSAPVKVVAVNAPTCTLSASPDTIDSGNSSDLSWTTTNAVSFVINNGVGTSTPVASGSTSVSPSDTTTYTGTATDSNGSTATCAATVNVNHTGGGGGPSCSISINPTSVSSGNSATVTWSSSNTQSAEINQGIGSVDLSGSTTTTKLGVASYEYTLTVVGNDGTTKKCSTNLQVTGGSGGCSGSSCGGGNTPPPTISFASVLQPATPQPLAFITLAQIPYTGLELGPIGTAIYWLILALWSIALAYLVLFKLFPWTGRKLALVGTNFKDAIDFSRNETVEAGKPEVSFEVPEESYEHKPADMREGFATFKKEEEALSIEDIVQGLARSGVEAKSEEASAVKETPVAPRIEESVVEDMPEESVNIDESSYNEWEEISKNDISKERLENARPHADGTKRFVNALVSGDRQSVFGTLRRTIMNGDNPEILITDSLCALDETYRARVMGKRADDDMERVCAACDNSMLEEIIDILTNAIDTTYSASETGAKLALTRVLAVVRR